MTEPNEHAETKRVFIRNMYENWFLDYASYVILERAIPSIVDGLKPVQRRILHAMKEMDDGRYNKIANVIGQTMQYHPHGDASIGDAIIHLGQKDLLIDTQGNWGDIRTGDAAAASRYIEGRLTKFALEVVFNPKTTQWQASYDGRKKEPIHLPVKFPLLLAQGAEGIAVGLSTKILPHNFCELLEASILHLKKKSFTLYPDFPQGGMIDVQAYQDGKRGGKVRVRAHIEEWDKKAVVIRDVPFGITTTQLIDSILKANDQGKIKIKSVTNNTASEVEVIVHLAPGISADQTIDALYAFTDCEISLSPNICVIADDKPQFLTASDLLIHSVNHTRSLLKKELEIRLRELEDQWHYASLEKIFIENRIYRDIEEETSWEGVIQAIDKGLQPFASRLHRPILESDIIRLTEIKIKRISRYDSFKAEEQILQMEKEMEEVGHDLKNLDDFAIRYYQNLLKKYGKGRERKTEIRSFDTIEATAVAMANTRLYVNRKEGFIGTSLKKDEFAFECSDLDQIILFRKDGKMMVTRVSDKVFVGKDILHLAVFRKNDDRTTYNMIYLDGKSGISFAKRFQVTGVTRDKEYDLTQGNPSSRCLYFSANPNGEAETVTITLSPGSKARNKVLDFSFETMEIRGRGVKGNQVTKYPIRSIRLKDKGKPTLPGQDLWYDGEIGRLSKEEGGTYLGRFDPGDRLISFYEEGYYEVIEWDLNARFEADRLVKILRVEPEMILAIVYWDQTNQVYMGKRFRLESQTLKTRYPIIREGEGNRLLDVTAADFPQLVIQTRKGKGPKEEARINMGETIGVTGWKTLGTRLGGPEIKEIRLEEGRPQLPSQVEATPLF